MTFEGWIGNDINYLSGKEARIAKEAWEAGIQQGIDHMSELYDICPECGVAEGRHKMGCGRQR